jgi:3-oxoacyl-[acyl-carrier-protein] synthase-1
LEWIEECDQLHGGGPLNNAWGFIPGEAASAVLIASEASAKRFGIEAFGEVVGLGLAHETKLIKTDTVCIGEGLTHAFRTALAPVPAKEVVHNIFCDLNGETYRADEYGFTALRTKERFRAATDFIAPADCWGDIGAAGATLHIALAVICHQKRYGKGPISMVWASSESGERGAVVIRAFDPSGG